MYNEELKTKFIRNYTSSIHTAKVATVVFNALEKYENMWQADLCTRSKEELQPIINGVVGLRVSSQWMSLTILREYVKWCLSTSVPGACDGMLKIEVVGLDKVRSQMVASPLHLQKILDEVFEPESEQTVDNTYRCYFWLAYGGVKVNDIIHIRAQDVDFEQMVIHYKDTSVPIYREALPAFHNAVSLNQFRYKHPCYAPVLRDRVPGDTILRGLRADTPDKKEILRNLVSKKIRRAVNTGKTKSRLSFHRTLMSGLFYRLYERERAGLPIEFTDVASGAMAGRAYTLKGKAKLQYKRHRIAIEYAEDYRRWKLAFSM